MNHTQEQILARFNERRITDPLGFESGEYIAALDFTRAKEFLRDGVTEQEWDDCRIKTKDQLLTRIKEYMEFAWDKANNCRGISANRSVQHYIAWTWLAGDLELSEKIDREYSDNYRFYGKPILVIVAEHYGIDWRKLDNNQWTSYEDSDGVPADVALGRVGAA